MKFIFPLINNLIVKFNEKANKNSNHNNSNRENNFIIDESDIIISGQKMKLWKYI